VYEVPPALSEQIESKGAYPTRSRRSTAAVIETWPSIVSATAAISVRPGGRTAPARRRRPRSD